MAAAAPAAELLAGDREHLDAGLGELGVGGLVALVGDDRRRATSATTLLPSSHWLRSASNSSPPVGRASGPSSPSASLTSSRNERSETSPATPPSPSGRYRIGMISRDDRLVHRRDVAVAEREDGVEVHRRARRAASARRSPAARRRRRTGSAARMLTARAFERSPWPTSTTPSPTGMMSPPSSEALPQSWSTPPNQISNAGVAEARMEAVDRLEVERLVLARRPEHRVDRDAAVDPRARVAHEQRVRQRRAGRSRSAAARARRR